MYRWGKEIVGLASAQAASQPEAGVDLRRFLLCGWDDFSNNGRIERELRQFLVAGGIASPILDRCLEARDIESAFYRRSWWQKLVRVPRGVVVFPQMHLDPNSSLLIQIPTPFDRIKALCNMHGRRLVRFDDYPDPEVIARQLLMPWPLAES